MTATIRTNADDLRTATALVAIAWQASGTVRDGHHLGILADELVRDFEDRDYATSVHGALVDALRLLTEDGGEEGPVEDTGHIEIDGQSCFWWHNNATTEWTSDRPDWWDASELEPETSPAIKAFGLERHGRIEHEGETLEIVSLGEGLMAVPAEALAEEVEQGDEAFAAWCRDWCRDVPVEALRLVAFAD